ncbi:MAG: putative repeat-containing protein, partial [Verrucomicrobiales bacterium]|nr:putative repeat-containing protein [Verrucomicrobiales bacterium]
ATEKDPTFGLGWQRLAELEFSFGRSKDALAYLQKGFQISSRNPQAYSLQGFLFAAEGKISQARESFERALQLDGALGDAWLGRGLCRIRQGDSEGGREDLQMAAALEPQRSIFRSYLGKAFVNAGSFPKATHELKLATGLDPKDPTPWLYSAILNRRENNINQAVRDLEKSQELNNNRGVFRSELLLDQDRAVRSANLAAIYQDAGMYDVALREASRALNSDYANYSAHLFLANSYGALSDPHQATLRYETPAVSEYLLANLLAPAGAGILSQTVSQMEYGRLFEKDRLGLFSATEYRSTGNWVEYASQYGQSDKFSYAVDVTHRSDNGQRPNADFETTALDLKLKGQITRQDTALFELIYAETESGDQTPNYFNSGTPLRLKENQKPIALVGYHHEWAPGSHTLLLAGRLDDTALLINPQQQVSFFASDAGGNINLTAPPPGSTTIPPAIASFNNEGQLEIFTTELQQIWEGHSHTVVAGGRFQTGHFDNSSSLSASTSSELGTEAGAFTLPPFGIHVPVTSPALAQDFNTDFERVSLYAYDTWQILEPLRITAGLSYDHLTYPANDRSPPFSAAEESSEKVSPKAGIVWDITKRTTFRGSFSRSLGGVSFDQSFRLEPTQVGGFNQAYRSLMPEAIVGPQSSPVFETYALGLDHKFKSGTYVGIEAELLRSQVNRDIGIFDRSGLGGATLPASLRQNLNFEERSGLLTINQLLGDIVSAGIRYRVSEADLSWRIPEVPRSVNNAAAGSDFSSTLHQFNPYILLNHSSGFFLEGDSIWTAQANREAAAGLAGADFWQHNIYAGYRFWRHRAEVSVGLLNLTDKDYNLFPLNLYGELPRHRTFIARLQLSF